MKDSPVSLNKIAISKQLEKKAHSKKGGASLLDSSSVCSPVKISLEYGNSENSTC